MAIDNNTGHIFPKLRDLLESVWGKHDDREGHRMIALGYIL
jgi:hypothetical protein